VGGEGNKGNNEGEGREGALQKAAAVMKLIEGHTTGEIGSVHTWVVF